MAKYQDLPMDMADAALVRVAEREDIRRIMTFDRRDFSVYRLARKGPFTILPDAPSDGVAGGADHEGR